MSDLRVLTEARTRLKDKRAELAAVIASGEGALSDLSLSLTAIQNAIESLTKAIDEESRT